MLPKHENTKLPTLVGRTVKKQRQGLGFSQDELAWRARLHRTYINEVERGTRNLSMSTLES